MDNAELDKNTEGILQIKGAFSNPRDVQMAILNNSLVGIAFVKNRKIVQVNQKMADIFGYDSPEEIIGNSTRIVYRSEEDYIEIGKKIYSPLAEGKEARFELFAKKKDGTDIWVLLSGKSTGPEEMEDADSVWIFQDIDEMKRQETRLRSNVYRIILNNSLVGIVTVKKRRFVEVNKKMADIFGYDSPDEMIGKLTRILYRSDEENEEIGKNAYSTLAAGKEYKLEFIGRRKDGSEFWCVLTGKSANPEEMDSADSIWIFQDIDEMKKQEIKLNHFAYHDTLTGLPNRRLFEERIGYSIARADRNSKFMAVCFVDLDGFKSVNDNCGHDAGDLVLVNVSRKILSSLRKTDMVTRLGGDEFILLFEDLNNEDDLNVILSKIEKLICEPISIGTEKTVSVGASMGVCLCAGKCGISPQAILNSADKAMYASKANKTSRKYSWTVHYDC